MWVFKLNAFFIAFNDNGSVEEYKMREIFCPSSWEIFVELQYSHFILSDTSIFIKNNKKAFNLSTRMILFNPLTRGGVVEKKQPPPNSWYVVGSLCPFSFYHLERKSWCQKHRRNFDQTLTDICKEPTVFKWKRFLSKFILNLCKWTPMQSIYAPWHFHFR